MRRVAFVNEKGGTCKTTLCVNIGAWLAARKGLRVLIADLDTQGHAGKSLGLDVRGLSPTIRDLLVEMRNNGRAIMLVSADLDEVLALSDRMAIMYEGRFMTACRPGELNREQIGMLMGGVACKEVVA